MVLVYDKFRNWRGVALLVFSYFGGLKTDRAATWASDQNARTYFLWPYKINLILVLKNLNSSTATGQGHTRPLAVGSLYPWEYDPSTLIILCYYNYLPLIDLLEDILESAVVFLQDCVLSAVKNITFRLWQFTVYNRIVITQCPSHENIKIMFEVWKTSHCTYFRLKPSNNIISHTWGRGAISLGWRI